jgi:hypothetical protein
MGLLVRDIYQDNAFVTTTWLGNDALTLFLAVPILLAAMIFSMRGSLRARLIWLGALDYMLYNYAFYLFGAAFNALFLVYAALLGLSIFALIFGVLDLNLKQFGLQNTAKIPVKWIGAYFLFVAIGLGSVYLLQSIAFIVKNQLPAIISITGHPTNVIFALDLTLLIPWLVVGAIWLIKRHPMGVVLAGILNVKGPLYTLVLAINSVLVVRAGFTSSSELPLWATLTGLGLTFSLVFFLSLKGEKDVRS